MPTDLIAIRRLLMAGPQFEAQALELVRALFLGEPDVYDRLLAGSAWTGDGRLFPGPEIRGRMSPDKLEDFVLRVLADAPEDSPAAKAIRAAAVHLAVSLGKEPLDLSSLTVYPNLESLTIYDTKGTYVRGARPGGFPHLKTLSFNAEGPGEPRAIFAWAPLRQVKLKRMNVEDVEWLATLSELRHLELWWSELHGEDTLVAAWPHLEELEVYSVGADALSRLPSLRTLRAHTVRPGRLESDTLEMLDGVGTFTIGALPRVRRIGPRVAFRDDSGWEGEMRATAPLPELREIRNAVMVDLEVFRFAPNLERAAVSLVAASYWGKPQAPRAVDLAPLAHAAHLVHLDLRGVLVRHLDELPLPPETCARLETLALWDAGLTSLDGLGRFPRLRRLHVPRAEVTTIDGARSAPSLQHLDLRWCMQLADVTALGTLPALRLSLFESALSRKDVPMHLRDRIDLQRRPEFT